MNRGPEARIPIRLATLLILVSAWFPALATDVWRGTVGTARVVVEIPVDGATVYGRYF